jgi:hypothetical protein
MGGGGVGGSTASSTGTGVSEDCTNGQDDDGDNAVDCADSDCDAGFTCVNDPPLGWNGPAALFEGDPASLPACPSTHPTSTSLGNSGLVDTPAICSACTCGDPTGQCALQPLQLETTLCAMKVGTVPQPPPGICGPFIPPLGLKAVKASAPTFTGGACLASTVMVTRPPPEWQSAGLACSGGGLGSGCGAKASCAPIAEAPFAPGLCIWHSGDLACPKPFTDKHTFANDVLDTRGCTACTCGAAAVTCSATTRVYSDPLCGNQGTSVNVPNDGSCVAVSGTSSSLQASVTKLGGCPAGGGQPSGGVIEGALKTTVCCAL